MPDNEEIIGTAPPLEELQMTKKKDDEVPSSSLSLSNDVVVQKADSNSTPNNDDPAIPIVVQAGLFFFSALYTMFFSGAIFGWGPMQLMLEKDGTFEDKCSSSNIEDGDEDSATLLLPCNSQSATLIQIQLVATFMSVFSPFMGMFTDHFGALKLMWLLAFLGCSGIATSMIASSSGIHELHFVAFALTGLMFVATIILIVQTGIVLPGEKTQRRCISALNGLLDAGTVSYLGLYQIGKATNADYVDIMGGYLGFAVFCFGGAIFFWTKTVKIMETSTKALEKPHDEGDKKMETTEPTSREPEESEVAAGIKEEEDIADRRAMFASQKTVPDSYCQSDVDYVLISQREPWAQLRSQQYILMVMFFSIHLTRNNWTMATARDYLASLGDDDEGNLYTVIYTALSAASLVGMPFIVHIMTKYGFHAAFQMVNLLGLLHGIVQVSSKNLNVQVLGFVLFSFYRCFTFSASFSFLPVFLSGNTVGRGCGVMSFFAAVFSLVNLGLAEWTLNGLEKDFFIPNLLMCLMGLPPFIIAWKIGQCIYLEQDATSATAPDAISRSRHSSIRLTEKLAFVYDPLPDGEEEANKAAGSSSFRASSFRVLVNDSPTRGGQASFRRYNAELEC